MNDQELLTDFLTSEKKMSANYDTFASECVNVQLRDEFLDLLKQGHMTQTNLFQTAQDKGWYNPASAPMEQITQAYTKYSSQKPN